MAYVSQADKTKLAPQIKKVLNKYGMKGSISIRHHMSLVVTLQSGAIDFKDYSHGDGYIQVNPYWIDDHYAEHPTARDFLNELLAAMKGPKYFNDDDAMTDYFSRSHYTDINVGKWNKPYFLQETAKKTSKRAVKVPNKAKVTISDSNDTAESLARMNGAEINKFIESLMDRYPTLGENLMSQIGYAMLEKEES